MYILQCQLSAPKKRKSCTASRDLKSCTSQTLPKHPLPYPVPSLKAAIVKMVFSGSNRVHVTATQNTTVFNYSLAFGVQTHSTKFQNISTLRLGMWMDSDQKHGLLNLIF
jgi:hypothetical protein